MKAVGLLLRLFGYLFQVLLSLFLIGIAIAAGSNTLQLGMLPWSGSSLNHWVVGLGILGLLATLLAIVGIIRFLFPLWCLFVLVMLARGYFFSSYRFSGPEEWHLSLWLTAGAVLAFVGSLTIFRARKKA
ncbi:MAG: hypothetical protein ACRD9L_28625 [Bryobacteraceae bacterium]